MNVHDLWALLFGAITLTLLASPFYPAWREWRHPSDDWPLEVREEQPALRALANGPYMNAGTQHTLGPCSSSGSGLVRRQLLMDLPHARSWGDQGWRVQGDCHLPDDSCLPGSLVVTGKLTCGARSLVEGDVKVHGDVHMAPASLLTGALFAHNVNLTEGAQVMGPVVARATVQLGPRASIGHPEQLASLSAVQVVAADSARVHGPVWTNAQAAVS